MKATNQQRDVPPQLPGATTPSNRINLAVWLESPAWFAIVCVLVLAVARLIPYLPFPLPRCGFRALTGTPCPLCGSTHALIAWSHLDFKTAFRLNPLVAFAPVAVGVWLVLSLIDRWLGRDWARAAATSLQRKPWPVVILGVAALNWIYLIISLPR